MQTSDISQVGEANLAGPGTIIIDDAAGTLWSKLNDRTFSVLKAALTGERPVLRLTSGANQDVSLDAAMCTGLLCVVRSEFEFVSVKVLWLDVYHGQGPAIVTKVLKTKNSGVDTELWYHDGVFYVPPTVPHKQLNQQFSANSGTGLSINNNDALIFHGSHCTNSLAFDTNGKATGYKVK